MSRTRLLVLAAVLLGACRKAQSKGASGGPGGGPFGLPVEVAVVRQDTVRDEVPATGDIEALQAIDLRPEVEGRLVGILVEEGTEVAKGAPLLQVDDLELRAQVTRAEADADLARQALDRTRELMQQNASSTSDLEKAQAQARSTQAQLDLLKLRLNRTTVTAPFAGIVGQRYVSLGDYVNTTTRLVSLQTVNPQRAAVQVPERFAEEIHRGQIVKFNVAALPGRTFAGVVDFVDPVVQLPGRTVLVKARVPNESRELRPGMFIEAHLVTAVRPNAVIVPEEAVVPVQGATFVYLVVDAKAARREVELGVRTPGFVEVTRGVKPGDQVVVGGLEMLADGMPVMARVVQRGPSAATLGTDRP
ncbi:MAG TPA: efflux RND transporter periplasmic adaptor subunit [Gemmatimonadales bacterium]|nr:efflux RND transporter periplasmic adaptor subunit [Gemmatimonadales bacterium]